MFDIHQKTKSLPPIPFFSLSASIPSPTFGALKNTKPFYMNKLLMGACLTMAMQVGHSQTLPQLGKDPIEKIVAAMTAEEKVSLLVGTGMPGFGGQSAVVGSTQNLVPGAAGTTFPIERLGIPAIVVADGPAGLRISPTREGNEATYYCTAFPVATLLASTWNTALVKT